MTTAEMRAIERDAVIGVARQIHADTEADYARLSYILGRLLAVIDAERGE